MRRTGAAQAMGAHIHNSRCSWIRSRGARHGVRVPPTIPIRGETRGLAQHVVSAGASTSRECKVLGSCAYGNNAICLAAAVSMN